MYLFTKRLKLLGAFYGLLTVGRGITRAYNFFMSKPKRQPDKFFEAIPAVPVRPGFGLPEGEWADRLVDKITEAASPWARKLAGYAGAASWDIYNFGRRGLKVLRGRQAKRAYISLAIAGSAVGITAAIVLATATMSAYSADLANPSYLLNHKKTGTTILDRNGEVLFQTYGATNRKLIEIGQVPKHMVNATLAAEDPGFYSHPGFSWRATARAMVTNLTHGRNLQGGSTITQQLVKNTLLSSEKSYLRKYQEIILASQLEHRYSKDQILQMYLNEVYYGEGAYGIESAAQTYFHKPASQLTLGQSALLAGLPLGPSRFDPNLDPEAAAARRSFILDQMHQHGLITAQQMEAASKEPIEAYAQQITIRAPHFVFEVLQQLRQQYGDELVEQGGITVTTTLDLKLQEYAQQRVGQQVQSLVGHNVSNGALIAIDPRNGEVISLVGSYDYNNADFGKVNVVTSQRQPGSAFKPIIYSTAFKKGWNPSTMVDDKPLSIEQFDGTAWQPTNFDEKYRGRVTLRRALQNSLNIPTINVLRFAGLNEAMQTAKDLGITTLKDPTQYGLSFALGTAEVRPLDLAAAYATIANHGQKVTPKFIRKVQDRFGADITKPDQTTPPKQPALDPRVAYMISNVLSDNQTRAESFGPNSPLKLSRPAAAKTGTTENFRDDWTVGFVPQLATAVWMGNNDNSPIYNITGIAGAAPIWHDFMEQALTGQPVIDFARPDGVVTARVCAADGGLANPWDGNTYEEVFLKEFPQTKHCGTSAPKKEEPKAEKTEPKPAAGANPGRGGGEVSPAPTPPTYQCSDGVDNDGDGQIDYPADPGCSSATDNDETDPVTQTPASP